MTDTEKIKLIRTIILDAYDRDCVGDTDERTVGYVEGVLDAVLNIMVFEQEEGETYDA